MSMKEIERSARSRDIFETIRYTVGVLAFLSLAFMLYSCDVKKSVGTQVVCDGILRYDLKTDTAYCTPRKFEEVVYK